MDAFEGDGWKVRTNMIEEIIWRIILRRYLSLALGGRVVSNKGVLQILVHLHNRSDVSTTIAVVWSGPHSNELVVKHPLVALHHKLM